VQWNLEKKKIKKENKKGELVSKEASLWFEWLRSHLMMVC
jgi:hypothetical protein